MSSITDRVNAGYTGIVSKAKQIPRLNTASLKAVEGNIDTFNLKGHKSDLLAYPGTTLYRAVGYAPLEFSTLSGKGIVNLNRGQSKPDYSVSNDLSEVFSLPVGAKLLKVTLTNNGTPITAGSVAGLNVTTSDITSPGTPVDFIFTGAVATGAANTSCVNNAEGLSVYANVIVDASAKFGTAGLADPSPPITITSASQYISVVSLSVTLTGGDLAVVFEYTL